MNTVIKMTFLSMMIGVAGFYAKPVFVMDQATNLTAEGIRLATELQIADQFRALFEAEHNPAVVVAQATPGIINGATQVLKSGVDKIFSTPVLGGTLRLAGNIFRFGFSVVDIMLGVMNTSLGTVNNEIGKVNTQEVMKEVGGLSTKAKLVLIGGTIAIVWTAYNYKKVKRVLSLGYL